MPLAGAAIVVAPGAIGGALTDVGLDYELMVATGSARRAKERPATA